MGVAKFGKRGGRSGTRKGVCEGTGGNYGGIGGGYLGHRTGRRKKLHGLGDALGTGGRDVNPVAPHPHVRRWSGVSYTRTFVPGGVRGV